MCQSTKVLHNLWYMPQVTPVQVIRLNFTNPDVIQVSCTSISKQDLTLVQSGESGLPQGSGLAPLTCVLE